MLGRAFTGQDDVAGSPDVVMLSHGYWQRRFGGDPGVVGRRLMIDGTAREVIGVLPRGFWFMDMPTDVVLPLRSIAPRYGSPATTSGPSAGCGQARRSSRSNADVARMIRLAFGKFPPPQGMSLQMMEDARLAPNVRPLVDDLIGDIGSSLWVVMATIGIVLLIACANVANLLLVRTEGRAQELAVRTALGAGKRPHRARDARREPAPRPARRRRGARLRHGRAEGGAHAQPGAPAAARADWRGCDVAAVHRRDLGRRRSRLRRDPRAQARARPPVRGAARRRTHRQRQPRSQPEPQRPDGRAGRPGSRAADRVGADDPNLPVDAARPAGLHRAGLAPDIADRHPWRRRQGRRPGAGQAGGDRAGWPACRARPRPA